MIHSEQFREIYLVKGKKQQLVERIVPPFSQRMNCSAGSYSINQVKFRTNVQLTSRSSALIKRLEDALRLHANVTRLLASASNRLLAELTGYFSSYRLLASASNQLESTSSGDLSKPISNQFLEV